MGCAFSASWLVIVMPDLMVTRGNLDDAMSLIQDEIERNHVALVSVSSGTTGKWGMSRLWFAWMNSVAKWMASQGVTMPLAVKASGELYGVREFNKDDAHELFTKYCLGCDADGARLSWAKSPHDGMRVATKGERLHAMRRMEAWATERGIVLFNPRDSEYRQMIEQQDA